MVLCFQAHLNIAENDVHVLQVSTKLLFKNNICRILMCQKNYKASQRLEFNDGVNG